MRSTATHSRRWCGATAATAAIVMLAVPLAAHDFWLQPSSFTPAADTVVRLQLRVGDDYPGEPIARNAANIEAFFVHGPDGRRPIAGQNGMDPAGLLRVTTPSTYLVGYRSRQVPVSLAAPAFEQYLKEEGLEHIIELRAKNNQSKAPGRERFSRSVKTLLHVGGSAPAGHDTLLGLTLELVPDTHPSALPADGRMGFQLLYAGKPLEGAMVVAIPQASAGRAAGQRRKARTSRDGRVLLSLAEGPWTVKAVHMVAAREGSGADWESIWASLTFNASAAASAAGK